MNILTQNNQQSMTSQQIAELVGSRHDVVRKSIERLVTRGVIQLPLIEKINLSQTLSPNNKTVAYVFTGEQGRVDSIVVVAQIAPQKIADVIKYFDSMDSAISDLLSALNAFDVPDDVVDMFVYAIKEKETGRLKIGISRNPQERLRQLQTGNSSELELVAYKKAESYQDERLTQKANSQHWIRGEWFTPSASLEQEVV